MDDHNLGMVVCLLNFLNSKLICTEGNNFVGVDPVAQQMQPTEKIDRHVLSIVLGAMTLLSKGNRTIRKYFKAQVKKICSQLLCVLT